jgi:hypothetical protein
MYTIFTHIKTRWQKPIYTEFMIKRSKWGWKGKKIDIPVIVNPNVTNHPLLRISA